MHSSAHCNTVYNSQDMEATSVLSTEKYIKKKWYIYTMEYYLAKNKRMPFAAQWMDINFVILSGVSQTEKDKYHMILLMCEIYTHKER